MKIAAITTAVLCGLLCHADAADISTLWRQFEQAKQRGSVPTLPDYSYAGYALGEKGIPPVTGRRFNVTDFGAIPNDNLSDRVAIEKAIRAAASQGGGIVFFPPGLFLVSEEAGVGSGILIHGEQIVLKGSGSGPGGTEIFMRNYLMPEDPEMKYSVPAMFEFSRDKGESGKKKCTTITQDAPREAFGIVVADASSLKPGLLIELSMNNPEANAEFLDGLKPWSIWKTTNEEGVMVRGEKHRIKRIDGNRITFFEPVHCAILAKHGWTVSILRLIPGWGAEDIHFRGNWKEAFVHHKDFIHDSGWSLLAFHCGDSPVLRRCRFSDCCNAVKLAACYAGTILNCSVEGNMGHESFSSSHFSYGTLMAFCADTVTNGAFHGFSASHGSVGTVITHCKNSDRGFDWHASWPYCSLIDACTGGLIGNGGNVALLPNHMRYLTFWNFRQTAGEVYREYDWWEPRKLNEEYSGAKVVHPVIVGYHGLGTTFKTNSCGQIESQGVPVSPASLYEAQLEARLGAHPAWIDKARTGYKLFVKNGYWQPID
jgi:hypothetical protein